MRSKWKIGYNKIVEQKMWFQSHDIHWYNHPDAKEFKMIKRTLNVLSTNLQCHANEMLRMAQLQETPYTRSTTGFSLFEQFKFIIILCWLCWNIKHLKMIELLRKSVVNINRSVNAISKLMYCFLTKNNLNCKRHRILMVNFLFYVISKLNICFHFR